MPATPDTCFHKLFLTGIALVSLIICLGVGCGKKGLPVPPNTVPPPTVSDLQGTIENNTVILSWTVPDGVTAIEHGLSEFKVFRFLQDLETETCPDCPVPFHIVGRVPSDEMKPAGDASTLSGRYTEPAVPGQVYKYHVVGYGRGGRAGDKSNIIRIVCPPELTPSPDAEPASGLSGDN